MAIRKIIRIDEAKCNGCGNCVTACAEGALKIVDGKARLVKEQFCDGFGDCMGDCPTGALTIEERDSVEFDIGATAEHLRATQGDHAVKRMVAANVRHEQKAAVPAEQAHAHAGCPGSRMRFAQRPQAAAPTPAGAGAGGGQAIRSELDQWPVQIHLVQPGAPFFHNRELVVLSTCAPVACADAHWRFIRGRGVAVGCPKLDRTEGYVEKLAAILADATIPKVQVVRMEVPCCGGLTMIVREAVRQCGRTDLQAEEVVVGLNGDVKQVQPLEA